MPTSMSAAHPHPPLHLLLIPLDSDPALFRRPKWRGKSTIRNSIQDNMIKKNACKTTSYDITAGLSITPKELFEDVPVMGSAKLRLRFTRPHTRDRIQDQIESELNRRASRPGLLRDFVGPTRQWPSPPTKSQNIAKITSGLQSE